MRGSIPVDQLLFDPEIERTARRLNSSAKRRKRQARQREERGEASTSSTPPVFGEVTTMAENQPQPQPPPPPRGPCVNSPRHNAQFARQANARVAEMKTGLLQLLYASPFHGHDHEDPYTHLTKFYEIAGAAGAPEDQEEQYFQRLFPHSLVGKAKDWYLDQLQDTMTNWNVLEEKFLERCFPQSRFMEAKTVISVFSQGANEPLNRAWERYKSMLRKCPSHGFDELTQIHIFRNGLQPQHKLLLDATAGGSLMAKTPYEAIQIIEKMGRNDHQTQHDQGGAQVKTGVLEIGSSHEALVAQNKLFAKQVEELTKQMARLPQQIMEMQGTSSKQTQQIAYCELCKGDHKTGFCPPENEEANYVANQGQGYQQRAPYPYQNQGQGYQQRGNQGYQGGWRQDNTNQGRQNPYQTQNQNQAQPQNQPQNQVRSSNIQDTLAQFMQASMANQKSTEASIKNLETQVGQLAKQISEQSASTSFSPTTQTNPKEHCKAITTRSGRVCDEKRKVVERKKKVVEKDEEVVVEEEVVEKDDEVVVEKNDDVDMEDDLVENEVLVENEKENGVVEKEKVEEKKKKMKKGKEKEVTYPLRSLPYPHLPSKKDDAKHYARFMDIFKQLQINIPFTEALEQMPKYAKFMKDILTKKKRYTDQETIMVDASCSAIIERTRSE